MKLWQLKGHNKVLWQGPIKLCEEYPGQAYYNGYKIGVGRVAGLEDFVWRIDQMTLYNNDKKPEDWL